MRALRKVGFAALTAIAIAGTTVSLPGVADARGGHGAGGHWGGGGRHWGGGWRGGGGWGYYGGGLAAGAILGGLLAAPYYGYYGGPYYDDYAYGGGCYIKRRWVINRYGHRVWRRVRVCY